jgi:hypothetical protein
VGRAEKRSCEASLCIAYLWPTQKHLKQVMRGQLSDCSGRQTHGGKAYVSEDSYVLIRLLED